MEKILKTNIVVGKVLDIFINFRPWFAEVLHTKKRDTRLSASVKRFGNSMIAKVLKKIWTKISLYRLRGINCQKKIVDACQR